MSRGLAAVSRRRDFASLAASRRRARSGPVRVVHAPFSDGRTEGVEVAFGISRAVGTAVVRNRIRRRLRSLMRESHDAGLVPAGRVLVSVSPAAVEVDYALLRHHLHTALAAIA